MIPLILGAKGLVGSELLRQIPSSIGWDREDVDVTNFELLKNKILSLDPKPSVVINCVAYNDVDGAETNVEVAHLLNSEVPKQLSMIANELNIPLVHFSTGYVFNGEQLGYKESDLPDPISVYAKSKLAGEQEVLQSCEKGYVIRTNSVFGQAGTSAMSKASFIDKVIEKAKTTNELTLVDDEILSVAYTPDLVKFVITVINEGYPKGVYHAVNEGYGSWYDIAEFIFKDRPEIILKHAKGTDFPRPAKRPKHSVLLNTKLPKQKPWQEAVTEYIKSF